MISGQSQHRRCPLERRIPLGVYPRTPTTRYITLGLLTRASLAEAEYPTSMPEQVGHSLHAVLVRLMIAILWQRVISIVQLLRRLKLLDDLLV